MKLTMGMLLTNLRRNIGSGPTLATLPVEPVARWSAQFSTVTTSGGRVTSATDIKGLAGLTEGASGAGPFALTDLTGYKFWRFEGAEYLNVLGTLTGIDNRNCSIVSVGRIHQNARFSHIFGLGNVAQGTTQVTGAGQLASRVISFIRLS